MILRVTFDKTGFPMVKVRKVGTFHLWPVTKHQFDQFLQETGRYDDVWYQSVGALNDGVSPEAVNQGNYERLFMTGVLPAEVMEFARWLGEDFDIPTEKEWLTFYREVKNHMFLFRLSPYALSESAGTLSGIFSKFLRTPLGFSFLKDGVVEWVKSDEGYAGRGAPRDAFFPNAWNPAKDTIQVIDPDERIFYFGFRLLKRDKVFPRQKFFEGGSGGQFFKNVPPAAGGEK